MARVVMVSGVPRFVGKKRERVTAVQRGVRRAKRTRSGGGGAEQREDVADVSSMYFDGR